VSGRQTVNYLASDNVGVKLARAIVAGSSRAEHHRSCDFAAIVPCVNGGGAISVDTELLGDGSHTLAVDAFDAASNLSASGPMTVRIDNTPPGAIALDLAGGPTWRNRNAFTVAWTNPIEGDRAPIAAARYQICRSGGSGCREVRQAGPDISGLRDLAVPAPGEWQLRVWREDSASNHEPANASLPVPLLFDPEPPQLVFEPLSPSDPTVVSVIVADQISGLASGHIELSRQGTGLWQALTTERTGGRLLARIDDAALPAGVYLLRATAWDQALNQNSSDRRANGEPMVISLPLRVPTTLRAGVRTERQVRRTTKRKGKRRRVKDRVVELRSTANVRYGDRVVIVGQLHNRDGQPVPNARVQVFSGSHTDRGQLIGALSTDAAGQFAYETKADATRTLRFGYAGTTGLLPSESAVNLLTAATSTLRATPRRLKNGQSVQLAGTLRALPPPPAGKLVEVQVVLSGRWQTFRTTRSQADGSWGIRYRFRRTCGLLRYRFRARLPAEAGYAFQTGYTTAREVIVRGPRCS
jgi:hypothetical protein